MNDNIGSIAKVMTVLIWCAAKALKYFFVLPAILLVASLAISSEFSFTAFFSSTYSYVSKVSQSAAESVSHVNQVECIKRTPATEKLEGLPPVSECSQFGLKSVTIEKAANDAAETAQRIYVWGVILIILLRGVMCLVTGRYPSPSSRRIICC